MLIIYLFLILKLVLFINLVIFGRQLSYRIIDDVLFIILDLEELENRNELAVRWCKMQYSGSPSVTLC